MKGSKELIYGLNDRPPIRETIFAALQHLLAVFVAITTPPLIISSTLKFDLDTIGFLVSMSLLVSGLATFIQCHRFSPTRVDLLYTQGMSFSFISPIIGAGMLSIISGKVSIKMGFSYIFGACLTASVVEMVVNRPLPCIRRIITPLVLGIVVPLTGMCLIKAGINSCGGDQSAVDVGMFGSIQNFELALLILASTIFFSRSNNRFLRIGSIVLGLLVGRVTAYTLNMVGFSSLKGSGSLNIPVLSRYGLSFGLDTIIGIGSIYLAITVEALGDIIVNSFIPGEPVEGPAFLRRTQGGVLADGFNSFLAAVFNSFPNSIFAQNNDMMQLTGVANRYVGYLIVGVLVLLGLFPAVGKASSLIPDPVLDGAALLTFGTIAAADIRIIASIEIAYRTVLAMAISFAMSLNVELVPGILDRMPDIIRNTFSGGITTGGLIAILADVFIRTRE